MPIYDLLTLNRAVQERKYSGRFFLETFFKKEEPSATATIEVDIMKAGGRKLAPIVSPLRGGVAVTKEGYETKTFKPPYLHPKDVITVKDLSQRSAGESPYAPQLSAEEKEAKTAGEYLRRLDDTIERRKEYMASLAVIRGKINIKGFGDDREINFQRDAAHDIVLSGSSIWGASGSDITGNLRNWKRLIAKDSGENADVLILGFKAVKPFFADPEIKSYFTTAGYNVAQMQAVVPTPGVTYYGRIPEFGDIYAYNEWYLDDKTGENNPLMPEDMAVYGARNADNRLYHGAIQNLHAGGGLVALEKFIDTFIYDNGKGREISIESAPLPALTTPDAFVSVKVL